MRAVSENQPTLESQTPDEVKAAALRYGTPWLSPRVS